MMTGRRLSRRAFLQLAGLTAGAVGLGVVLAGDPQGGFGLAPARAAVEITLAAAAEDIPDAPIERFNQEFAPSHVTRTALDLDRLPEALSGGEAPHAAALPALRVSRLGEQGVLADLSRFFSASPAARQADMFGVDGYFNSGEGRWGLALAWSPDYLVWANQPLWQRAGVELPAGRLSLADWRELSARLGGARDWGFGTDLTIDFPALLGLAQTLEPPVNGFALDGRLNLREQADFVELVRFVLDWKKEGGIPFRRSLEPLQAYIPDCT